MNKAYQFRIYPNKEQQTRIQKTFGCTRFIYNQMLADKIKHYEATKKKLNNTPAHYKETYPWLKEVDSLALANAQQHLQKAYQNFFRSPKIGFPKFKSKKRNKRSYTTNCVNNNIKLTTGGLVLPKLGRIKLKQHRPIPTDYRLKSATVTQSPSGKYTVSLLYEYEKHIAPKAIQHFLGLDFSMKALYRDSNGHVPAYPRYYRGAQDRLSEAQRKYINEAEGLQQLGKTAA